jgi:hypothetical protein
MAIKLVLLAELFVDNKKVMESPHQSSVCDKLIGNSKIYKNGYYNIDGAV